MSNLLLLSSSLAFISPLRGLPSPMDKTAPWYSDYDIEEYIYSSDYYGDYYGDYYDEEVKEVAEPCFADELNHQAIHLLRPLMGFLATMEKKEEDEDNMVTTSIIEQAANFSLVDTRFLVEGEMVSVKEVVQWGMMVAVEEMKEMGRCVVYGGEKCKGGRKGGRSGGKSSEAPEEDLQRNLTVAG